MSHLRFKTTEMIAAPVGGLSGWGGREVTEADHARWGIEKLNAARSDIPAVTHVDYSARVQMRFTNRDTG